MRILSNDTEKQLYSLAVFIGRNPMSWQGWMCLSVDVCAYEHDYAASRCMMWVRSILETYLKDVEGRVYVCEDRYIHIFGKDVDWSVMAEAADQISFLIEAEDKIGLEYYIYDLGREGVSFAHRVLHQSADDFLCDEAHFMALKSNQNVTDLNALITQVDFAAHNGEQVRAKPRILLVDDDQVMRWMVANTLKGACDFEAVQSASQVFSVYASFEPDLIFLDIELPDKSGLDVLAWILKNDPGANVVMFSSHDSLDNIADTLEKGASGFIAKPFVKRDILYYVQGYNDTIEVVTA